MRLKVLDIVSVCSVATALILVLRANLKVINLAKCDVAPLSSMDDIVAYDHKNEPIYRRECLVHGAVRKDPAYLLVGIPTLYRKYKNETAVYVIDTVKSFLDPLTPLQKEQIQILIILTDLEPLKKKIMYDLVEKHFSKELLVGLLNIISIPQRFYPNLYDIPSTLNDGPTRMYWRGKQSLDYSFIAGYAHNICQYFMQTEDDAVPNVNYFNIMTNDIREKSAKRKLSYPWQYDSVPWLNLMYTRMGYIGIVFPDSTLPFMSFLTKAFYGGYPVDLTMRFTNQYLDVLQHQQREIFVHHGKLSSSKGTV